MAALIMEGTKAIARARVSPYPAIAGTWAVVLLIGGTRWGSYIGSNPVFLTDILLFGAGAQYLISRQLRPDKFQALPRPSRRPWLLLILAAYVAGRFLVGQQMDLIAMRDAAPYLYAVAGIMAWSAARWAPAASLERTRQLLFVGLCFHAVWFFVVLLVWPSLPLAMPTLSADHGLHVFSMRADVDTTLVGVLAAVLVNRIIRGAARRLWFSSLAFGACWISIISTSSRAGLIGALAVNLYALVVGMRAGGNSPSRKLITAALLPLLLGFSIALLPSTDIGTRLIATAGVSSDSSDQVAQDAAGTTHARSQAWEGLVEWTLGDSDRFFWGEGVGPNIMTLSGAGILLTGDTDDHGTEPRSPHNYWAGSFARLGLIGTIPLVLLVGSFLWGAIRVMRDIGNSELRFILQVIPLSLLVPASLGVVLESPFGAVPFFWCIGALVGLGRQSFDK